MLIKCPDWILNILKSQNTSVNCSIERMETKHSFFYCFRVKPNDINNDKITAFFEQKSFRTLVPVVPNIWTITRQKCIKYEEKLSRQRLLLSAVQIYSHLPYNEAFDFFFVDGIVSVLFAQSDSFFFCKHMATIPTCNRNVKNSKLHAAAENLFCFY